MREHLDSLLQQKMTRKEFLQFLGSGLLVIFGVSSLIKAFDLRGQGNRRAIGSGYGMSAYGGRSK